MEDVIVNTPMINAELYRRMLCAAVAALQAKKEDINHLNVFPVPDGDTGSNMFMTLEAARSVAAQADNLAAYAEASAKAIMRSARGNSGVILSLFFRGVAQAFAGHETADAALLIKAFETGSESARKAVMKPVEGTILTVMRECTKFEASDASGSINSTLESISQKALEVLKKTPEMLPALKRAKVVDSGGYGFTIVLSGMIQALNGETLEEIPDVIETVSDADFSAFSEEEIIFSFCTECLINRAETVTEEKIDELRVYLAGIGDSVVLVADDEIVKVHVHTNEPMSVLNRMLTFGVPQFIKVENMKQQHSAIVTEAEQKELIPEACGVITVANGDGLRDLFMELGAGYVIAGGQSMNPSANDFLKAIRELHCKRVILLPNNSNIVLTAQQAAAMAEGVQVEVVRTVTIPQGISALVAFKASASMDDNIREMDMAVSGVKTLAVTRAVKNADIGEIHVKRKQYIGLVDNNLRYAKDSIKECLLALAGEIGDREIITLYYGRGVKPEEAEDAADILRQAVSPDAEVSVVSGSQPIYTYLISAE